MNTKFTFYCTHCQYGGFEKVIFETVLPGTPFSDIEDTRVWIDDNIDTLYNEFNFDLVFDWVALHYKNTNDVVSPVEIKETISGRLSFHQPEVKTKVNNIKKDTSLDDEISKLKNEISNLKYDVEKVTDELDIEKLKASIVNLNKEAEKLRAEINKKEPVKEEKDYPSCWIDTSGTKYVVGFSCHNDFAGEWLMENKGEDWYEKHVSDSGRYDYEVLQGLGWIRILGWTDPPTFVLPADIRPKLRDALKSYCVSNDVSYNDWPEILKS